MPLEVKLCILVYWDVTTTVCPRMILHQTLCPVTPHVIMLMLPELGLSLRRATSLPRKRFMFPSGNESIIYMKHQKLSINIMTRFTHRLAADQTWRQLGHQALLPTQHFPQRLNIRRMTVSSIYALLHWALFCCFMLTFCVDSWDSFTHIYQSVFTSGTGAIMWSVLKDIMH